MSFGERLKNLRNEKEKTQLEVAKYVGVEFQTIYKYEKNISSPSPEVLIKLAEYFNTSTDYLLGVSNDLHMASSSDIDLAKLSELSPTAKKIITNTMNNLIEDFYKEKRGK